MAEIFAGDVLAVLQAIPGDPSSDHAPAIVVGAANQWSNAEAESYAITESYPSPPATFEDDPIPNAYFPPTVFATPPTTWLYVRCSSTTTYESENGRDLLVELHHPDDADDIFRVNIDLVADAEIHEYTVEIFPQWWMGPADIAYYGPAWIEALAAGAWVIPYSQNHEFGEPDWTSTVKIWDLWLIVEDEVTTTPLRKYPRRDGRGMSPVRRGYPLTPAPRLIGGQP